MLLTRRLIPLLLCFNLLVQAAPSIDDYIKLEMRRQHIPGLALGIYERGKIVKAQGYGFANVELDAPVKPDTIFQSGSVGKQFAATAIMMLVEEGKIDLDKSISAYFENAPKSWAPIKVKNLLSHTSGLGEYENDERTKSGGPFWLRLDYTEDEMFAKIAGMPLDFQPGEKWRYTNTNYVLLGMMIHKVTGKFYGDYLTERIFQPLGMTSTRIISEADIIHGRSSGYRLVKGELKNQEWVSPTFNSTADGALYFNIPDLAKWDAALYTENLVKKSTLDQMWTPFSLNDGKPNPGHYGFAWLIESVNGHRVIEHGGAWQGFTTYIARYVDDGITVVVLTNLDSEHSNPGKVSHAVAGLYKQELTPPVVQPVADKDPQATALLRDAIGHSEPDTEEGKLLREMGTVTALEPLVQDKSGAVRNYRYRVIAGNNRTILFATITEDGKISRLSLRWE